MSDSVRPNGLQPTRLLCPWDSPVKNTGVGCHFLLQCMKVESESEVAQLCLTLSDPMDCSLPGSSIHGIFRATVLEWGAIASTLSNFKICNTGLLTVVTMVYITSLGLNYFISRSMTLPFTQFFHPPPPSSDNHQSVLCICELGYLLLLFIDSPHKRVFPVAQLVKNLFAM